MPTLHLTDLSVRAIRPSDRYVTYWSDTTPGFGIRIGKHSRTWTVMRGRTRERVSIGRYPNLSLSEARKEASASMANQHDGGDKVSSEQGAIDMDERELREQMSRGAQTAWIVAAIGLVGIGIMVLVRVEGASREDTRTEAATIGADSQGERAVAVSSDVPDAAAADKAVTGALRAAEQRVEELQGDYESALDDVQYGGGDAISHDTDSEAVASLRRIAELEELSCRKYGTNCEEAQLMRKQVNEMQRGL